MVCCGSSVRNVNKYVVEEKIGAGAFANIYLAVDKESDTVYAVKIMPANLNNSPKTPNFLKLYENEVDILTQLKGTSDCIVTIQDSIKEKKRYCLVLEYCQGGELFKHISKRKRLREFESALLTKQMLEALVHIHKYDIIHRDIKAENFMFAQTIQYPKDVLGMQKLKLIDFGMALRIDEAVTSRLCGSPHYVAPELYDGKFSKKSDMWALGVTCYLMIYGHYPYNATTYDELKRKIIHGNPDYLCNSPPPSLDSIDFLQKLLKKNPDERLTAEEALNHPWLKKDWALVYKKHVTHSHRKSLLEDTNKTSKWKVSNDTRKAIRNSIITEATLSASSDE